MWAARGLLARKASLNSEPREPAYSTLGQPAAKVASISRTPLRFAGQTFHWPAWPSREPGFGDRK